MGEEREGGGRKVAANHRGGPVLIAHTHKRHSATHTHTQERVQLGQPVNKLLRGNAPELADKHGRDDLATLLMVDNLDNMFLCYRTQHEVTRVESFTRPMVYCCV